MGRVYEALKRAAEQNGTPADAEPGEEQSVAVRPEPSNGNGHAPAADEVAPAPEYLFHASRHFQTPETAHTPAPNEQTSAPGGSALPAGQASRAAGATLGAAGSARTPEFVRLDVSAARVEPHLVAITQPRSSHAERYRSLRTRVLHAGERRKMQAFVITSAGIMEGKTLTAVNLSWLLAQTDGVRALLIDGDLRNPCAADYLGLDAPTGLSEVLAGEARLEEAIVRLEPAGLHVLPGGSARDDVAELLSGPRFLAVLQEVRRMFDYVIIDAPPLGIFTDATVLISRADSALIVARAGKTRYSALEKLLEPLPRERLLGVVLNGSDEQLNEQNYYYRRYSRRGEAGEE
ncbi:MAG: CpsD/CapB family tyrosine-protein kinase [Acidobacteria bacterium]|nr:CpsD/CapB family tyrosine-protein kinase [Acidobacteriota bacterium]